MVATYKETIKFDLTCNGSYDEEEVGGVYDHQVYWNEDVRFHSSAPLVVLEPEFSLNDYSVSEDEMLCNVSVSDYSLLPSRCSSKYAGEIDSYSDRVLLSVQESSKLDDIARSSSMNVR